MKMHIVIALVLALLLAGCGERILSRVSDVPAPEIAPPVAKHQSAPAQSAPAEERAQRAAPDFKDSAGSLDRSK